jgi:hypothetical protein
MPTGTATISPIPKLQLFTNAGAPAVGYQLFTYIAGSATKQATYADSLFAGANSNPIILDSAGRATVFLSEASYKFVLAPPTDSDPPTSPIWTVDGVQGVPAQAGNTDVAGVGGQALVAGEIVYLSDATGRWFVTTTAAAVSSVDAAKVGIIISGCADASGSVVVRIAGRVTTVPALTLGATYYLTTAGALVTPTPAGAYSRPFGFADTTHTLVFPITETTSSALRTAVKVFGFSAGQGCTTGAGTDDPLNSYTVTIPPNFLANPGDALLVEGRYTLAGNANAKVGKIRVGAAGTLVTIYTGNGNANIIPFRLKITRRTSVTGMATGITWVGAAAAGAPTNYLIDTAVATVDWTVSQALTIYANGAAADIVLTEYSVSGVRSYASALV